MGFNKRQTVLILWIGSMLFASFTLAISNASYSIERLVTIFVGALWLMLFSLFLRTSDN
jgi:type IV secretory pathway TrbL component